MQQLGQRSVYSFTVLEIAFGLSDRDTGRPLRDLDISYRPVALHEAKSTHPLNLHTGFSVTDRRPMVREALRDLTTTHQLRSTRLTAVAAPQWYG